MSKTLKLTLKKQWFDMILLGEKFEEYREIKPYWINRLCKKYPMSVIDGGDFMDKHTRQQFDFKSFDFVEFTNGYNKKSPQVTKRFMGIEIGIGKKEFGAPDYPVFKIILAHEVCRQNC